jgi:hypothetical protein
MKKKLYSKFDKKEISELPRVSFPGRIITIISPGEADKAVDYLLSMNILGVDTETKPAFHRGEHHRVALLQVSTHDTCFLFRLNRIGITPSIKRLLEDKTVKKIGLSWHDDIHMLQDREAFTPGLFIDLQDLVPLLGIKDLSLQKLYANIFHKKISKRQRLSNWESPQLDDKQKQYAAIDAWTCVLLYEEMERLLKTKDYDLIVVPEPEPTVNNKSNDSANKSKDDVETKEVEENINLMDYTNQENKSSSVNKRESSSKKRVRKPRKTIKPKIRKKSRQCQL